MQNLYQDKHDPLCPERSPAEEEGGYNHNWKSEILLNTTGGGPRLDHRARLQFGRVHFGVFSMSRPDLTLFFTDAGSQLTFEMGKGGGAGITEKRH